jgi:hypothetical protein
METNMFGENFVDELKPSLLQLDFRKAAFRSGGLYDGEVVTLKILGRNFSITPDGNFKTDIHANPFISAPILDYLLNTTGAEPSGEWISFRKLKESDDLMHGFFKKRC